MAGKTENGIGIYSPIAKARALVRGSRMALKRLKHDQSAGESVDAEEMERLASFLKQTAFRSQLAMADTPEQAALIKPPFMESD